MATKISSVFRTGLFKGKTAIVTGGGTGIGKAITQELLYLGCNVMIASRKLERLEEAKKDINLSISKYNEAGTLQVIKCNIREENDVRDLVSGTLAQFGSVDYLVNNGGGQFVSPVADLALKGWKAVVETNLTGTFLMCREVYRQWMQDNGGVIVNIIADMWKGMPMMGHSGAARAGVDNLTKTLALEWAASGVRVNSVAPGSNIWSATAEANYGAYNVFETQRPRNAFKRLGKTEEISSTVCFLLSPGSSYISGETVIVDGAAVLMGPSIPYEVPEHTKLPAYTWEDDNGEPKSKL